MPRPDPRLPTTAAPPLPTPSASFFVLDQDLRILAADGSSLREAGFHPEALVGRTVADIVPAESYALLEPVYRATLAGEAQELDFTSPLTGRRWRGLTRPLPGVGLVAIVENASAGERALADVCAASPIALVVFHRAGTVVRVNPAVVTLVGDRARAGAHVADVLAPADGHDREAFLAALLADAADADADAPPPERTLRRPDGEPVRARIRVTALDEDRFLAQVLDVTAEHRAASALRRRSAQQDALAELAADVLASRSLGDALDGATRCIAATIGAPLATVTLRDEDTTARVVATHGFPDDVAGTLRIPEADRRLQTLQDRGPVVAVEDILERPHLDHPVLREQDVRSALTGLITARDGSPLGSLAVFDREPRSWCVDEMAFLVSAAAIVGSALAREAAERALVRATVHDRLTGLPSRTLLLDRVAQAQAQAEAAEDPDARVALLVVDVDRFQDVNDALGHDAADLALREIARRLQRLAAADETVARVGGDTFALVHEVESAAEAGPRAQAVLDAFAEPLRVEGLELRLQASVGVAVSTGESPEELLRAADASLHRAKAGGGGRWSASDPETLERAAARLGVRHELSRALERGELRAVFQPLREAVGGRVVGAEALVRWEHPERGLLGPGAFLEEAERSGLIVPMGEWMLREAARQGARWQARHPDFLVSVNVSPAQFRSPRLLDSVAAVLDESGLRPHCLGLELTEGALVDVFDDPREAMEALKALGPRLLLDDFGVGFSSLSRLRRLPFDILKIDRSFVSELGRGAELRDAAIVRAVVEMAHAVGARVVAEGVEHAEQAPLLAGLGADLLQGYALGRPATAEAFDALD